MLLLRPSHLSVFLSLLIPAFTHPLADQNEQQPDITAIEPRDLAQPPWDPRRLTHHTSTLSKRFLIIDGYQLSLSQHVQILPINIASEEIREFWTQVMATVLANWPSDSHTLSVNVGQMQVLFDSGDENVPLDWLGILHLASYMIENVCTGGGWVALFQGRLINLATQVAMRVTLQHHGRGF